MAIAEFIEDMNIISALPDAPTLTAAQLKGKFDEGGIKIKEYINQSLLPDIADAVIQGNEAINEKIENVKNSLPQISDSLEDESTTKALSAAMGKRLYSLIGEAEAKINSLEAQIALINEALLQKQNKIGVGTEYPSGGENGDIYLMY